MRIYFTGVDLGDGSLGVEFFDSLKCIELLEEHEPEYYRGEEGGSFEVIGASSISFRGIKIQTLAQVLERVESE